MEKKEWKFDWQSFIIGCAVGAVIGAAIIYIAVQSMLSGI